MNATKLILLGETQTGKTSIINRIIQNKFYEDVGSTLGKSQNEYKVELGDGQEVVFDVWDTAGQEKFRSLNKIFFKNARIALLIYSIDHKKSFDTLKEWCNIVKEECNEQPIIAIVANKADLFENSEVSENDGRELADSMKVPFFFISCKTGDGISSMFEELAKMTLKEENTQPHPNIVIGQDQNKETKKSGCGGKSKEPKQEQKSSGMCS